MLKSVATFMAALTLVAGFSISPASMAFAQTGAFNELLQEVNEMLSSDASIGSKLLDDLIARQQELDVQQRHRLQILIAKRELISGRALPAIEILLRLNNEDLTLESLILLNQLLATAYNITGDYEAMFERLSRGIRLLAETENPALKVGFLHPVILAYRDAGALDEALNFAQEMLRTSRDAGHARSECFALKELGDTYQQDDNLDRAMEYQTQAQTLCASIGNGVVESAAMYGLAAIALDRGAPEDALELLVKVEARAEAVGFMLLRSNILSARAQALLALQRFAEAADVAREGIEVASSSQYHIALRDLTRSLAQAEEALGRTEAALLAYKRHIAVNNMVQNDRLARRLAYHRTRYDTLEKERQIQLLSQQKELLTLSRQLERKTRQNLQLLLAIGGGLLIGLILWLMHSTGQRRLFRQQAECDGLTGLSNRTHFITKSRAALAASTDAPLSLIIFDLDHFKLLNDSYGHAAGDWILREVAARCRDRVRKSDIFGRIGGEEFAICMPGAGIDEAIRVAESCREALRDIDGSAFAPGISVSASFGISTRRPGERELDPIMIRADGALYDAKRAGRDMVRVADRAPEVSAADDGVTGKS